MKKILLLLPAIFIITSSFSPEYVPTNSEIQKFFQTKTLAVLEDNPIAEYNFVIKEFMQKEWKLTPYDFITYSEFETKRLDPQYSFILLDQVNFDKDKSLTRYNFLSLLLGGNERVISNMPDLCSVPLSYVGVDESNYDYKIQNLLRFMQNHVKLIRDNPKIVSANVLKYYNDNISDIKNKTLYLIPEELAKDCNTEAKIKKIYPYKFKLVTREEVSKAIDESNPDVVFLHKVGPEGTRLIARCYKIIIGAADSKFYYFDYHKISQEKPDGFLASDFKRLAKK
jgi:hypothetical protein